MPRPSPAPDTEVYVPHIGWLRHEPADEVALFLNQGWFEYREQALCWMYLREGDTFLDVGAHFGLYSALAACAGAGRVVAVEPNPATLPHLHANIVRHEARAACVVPYGLGSSDGTTRFYPFAGARAAYSSMFPEKDHTGMLVIETLTLDSLCRRYALEHIDLAKVDVEGAELEVLAGAAAGLERTSCLLIECTELNLRRSDRTTEALFQALQAAGLRVCSLDEERLTLVPRQFEGPIWYDNLIAARDPEAVNERLRNAPPRQARIAREIVARGRAVTALHQRAEEAKTQVEAAQRRMDQALALAEDAQRRMDQAQQRADQAQSRADEAQHRANEAQHRADLAEIRAAEAVQHADDSRRQLEESWKRIGEADWRASEARAETARVADQLHSVLSARLVHLGLTLGLLRDPRRGS